MYHWKGYDNRWQITEKSATTCHWSIYLDMECKGYDDWWWMTEKATVTCHWKGYNDIVDSVFTELHMKLLPGSVGYKSTSWEREVRRIHTHSSKTIGSKEPEPWSPRWVRQQLRERRNDLPPNDPNHDEKPPDSAERPLCKCDLECQHHISIDYDTYSRRYWSFPQPTYPFHWGWDEEKPMKVVSVLIFTLHILNKVGINRFLSMFALSSSHRHWNHQDVISSSELKTIWHRRT
jgi:hypothetical protein